MKRKSQVEKQHRLEDDVMGKEDQKKSYIVDSR